MTGPVVTADCWTRLRAARRLGIAVFLATLLMIVWAEWLAARFGLQALRRLTGPRPATPVFAQSHVPSFVPLVPVMGAPPPPPKEPPPSKSFRPPSKLRFPRATGHYGGGVSLPVIGR